MKRRVMTEAEFAELRAALQDPDYVAKMLADGKAANMVEVDNPFRTEMRPRRGTE